MNSYSKKEFIIRNYWFRIPVQNVCIVDFVFNISNSECSVYLFRAIRLTWRAFFFETTWIIHLIHVIFFIQFSKNASFGIVPALIRTWTPSKDYFVFFSVGFFWRELHRKIPQIYWKFYGTIWTEEVQTSWKFQINIELNTEFRSFCCFADLSFEIERVVFIFKTQRFSTSFTTCLPVELLNIFNNPLIIFSTFTHR